MCDSLKIQNISQKSFTLISLCYNSLMLLTAQHQEGFIMATFHEGISERKNESISDDSPYQIFTPDDIQHQDDTTVTYSTSTFQPRQLHHQGPSTISIKTPYTHSGLKSAEESVSSSLPRHGSHGSKTATHIPRMIMSQRNRSVDNVAASFVKSLPPRGQYYPLSPSSFTKALPPRQAHHGSISNTAATFLHNYPNEGSTITSPQQSHACMMTSGRKASRTYVDNKPGDNGKPTPKHLHVSEEYYDRLLPPKINTTAPNVVHRNAAYESIVHRPFKETGCNYPVFNTESEHDQMDITDVGNWPSSYKCGSETNFFEMCSDDSLKNDQSELKAENEQEKTEKTSQHPFNDYENTKEYMLSSTYSDSSTTPQIGPNLFHTAGVQNEGSHGQKFANTCTDDLGVCKHRPDYENVKDYDQCANTKYNKTPEWISLAAIPNTLPNLAAEDGGNWEKSIQTTVPKIIVQSEQSDINGIASEHQIVEQGNISSLGKDLRKSADLETLSDYEEMASSFSSHYTGVKSNQQQPFPFLSSTEVEGPITLRIQQEDDEQHNTDSTTCTSMGNEQHNEHTGSEPTTTRNAKVPAPKTKKEKCFQYCLIFITLAIAIAALIISTIIFIDIESGKNNATYSMN